MDIHAIDEEGGMGHHGMCDDGDSEANEYEAKNSETALVQDEDGIAEPYVCMEFDSEDAAKTFYDACATVVGFSSKVGHLSHPKPTGTIISPEFVCGREGSKRKSSDSCDAVLGIELKGQNKWVVTKFIKEHNHSLMSPSKVHDLWPHRHFAGAAKSMAESYQGVGIVPSDVMYVSMDGNRATAETNNLGIRNTPPAELNQLAKNIGTVNYAVRPVNRKRTLGTDAQNLLDYFKKMQAENPGFFYAIQLDDDNCMANVF
ncbi:hypothetical protein SLE2022_197060 [Rubroshorea leprosula]